MSKSGFGICCPDYELGDVLTLEDRKCWASLLLSIFWGAFTCLMYFGSRYMTINDGREKGKYIEQRFLVGSEPGRDKRDGTLKLAQKCIREMKDNKYIKEIFKDPTPKDNQNQTERSRG